MSFKALKSFIPLGLLFYVKELDSEDQDVVMYSRVFFTVCMLVVGLIWLYVMSCIQSSQETRKIKVSEKDMQPSNPVGDALAEQIDPNRVSSEKKEMLATEYDMNIAMQKLRQALLQSVIVAGIHYKWEAILPLILSAATSALNLFDEPLVRLYLLGAKEEDDEELKRPFKAKSPLVDAISKWKEAQEQQTALNEPFQAELKGGKNAQEERKEEKQEAESKKVK